MCVACGRVVRSWSHQPAGTECIRCVSRRVAAAAEAARMADIVAVVADVEPDLAPDVIVAAVRVAAPARRTVTVLARALATNPGHLTAGGSDVPAVVGRLAAALRDVGGSRIRQPVCAECGRTTALTRRRGGQRICHVCAERGRGRPIKCCVLCGRTAPCIGGTRRGEPRCETCARRRIECAACTRVGPVAALTWRGALCSTCWEKALLAKAECAQCGQWRRPDPRAEGNQPMCSDCAGLERLQTCDRCGDETRIYAAGRCKACVLHDRATAILTGPDGQVADRLVPLLDALAASRPKAALRWLAKPHTHTFLTRLAAGDVALTHGAMDDLGASRHVDHLRSVLIAAGVLDPRDEVIARFELWIANTVEAIEETEDRHIVDTYATWWVLRRYRQRALRRPTHGTHYGRNNIGTAVALLAWLRARGLSLAAARQRDIDLWAASQSDHRRRSGHDFLRWATKHHLVTDVQLVRRPDREPSIRPAPGLNERSQAVADLLHSTNASNADRVASLLVLLYAQAVTDIVQLTVDDVGRNGEMITITLGTDPIDTPHELGSLICDLVDERQGRAAVAATTSNWLFPGGQPGRHLGADRLALRLQALGLNIRATRTNTLHDLASDGGPVIVLADLLGLHPNTAARWTRAAAGDWSTYAAVQLGDQFGHNE